jgi:hypothetical protein
MLQGAKLTDKFKVFLEKPRNQGKIFIFLGIVALGFGTWNIMHTISSPFNLKNQNPVANQQVQLSVQDEIKNLSVLRSQDTDNDGLSDYDEMYVYGTSPYIEDTDSDGYADKTEIDSGNNPNCKAGEKCLLNDTGVASVNGQTSTTVSTAPPDPYTMSASEIRSLLLKNGVDKATLDQVDDDTLRQMFIQAYTEAQQTAGQTVNSDTASQATSSQVYTPAELRQLLIQKGLTKEQVDAVTDDELMKLYQEVISSSN